MKKRIIETTFASGKSQYRVEVARRILGITLFWTLDSKPEPLYPERLAPAVLCSLDDAAAHCGLAPEDMIMKTVVAEISYDEVQNQD